MVRLSGIDYGFFQANSALVDCVNVPTLMHPLICLGDCPNGVWNLFSEIAPDSERWKILDWYHFKENFYKVGGSIKRLTQAETFDLTDALIQALE